MSNITLRTFALIQDIIPMSKALELSEEEGLTLLKYKDLMIGKFFKVEKKAKPVSRKIKPVPKNSNRNYIVWKCPILSEEDNLLPAGRKPKQGCGKMNIMTTAHSSIKKNTQTSPCSCGKRNRRKGLMYFYTDYNDALKQMEEGI